MFQQVTIPVRFLFFMLSVWFLGAAFRADLPPETFPKTQSAPCDSTEFSVAQCNGTFYVFGGDTLKTSGFFKDTLTGASGCDSIVILQLSFVDTFKIAAIRFICSGDTLFFGGDTLTTSGIYTHIFTAVGGCDSIVNLKLNVLPLPQPSEFDTTICSGQNFDFAGQNLTAPGDYIFNLQGANGCDSVVTVNLSVLDAPPVTETVGSICFGETLFFNGQLFDSTGNYVFTFPAANGCDSVEILYLTVLPDLTSEVEIDLCDGETFDFEGVEFDQSGVFTFPHITADGCDSTIVLTLNFHPVQTNSIAATICGNEPYQFGNQLLTISGTYFEIFSNQFGCDSTVTLELTVLPSPTTLVEATICENEEYIFNGQTFSGANAAGTYVFINQAENGCDSTVTLELSVLPVSGEILEETICEGETFEFYGSNLTSTGIYFQNFTAQNGCDSVILLNLTVLQKQETLISASICDGESFDFDNQSLIETGVYFENLTSENGCDSTVILNLTVLPVFETSFSETICAGETFEFDGQILDETGLFSAIFTAENGCDSTVNLNLTVLPTIETALAETICENETFEFNGEILTDAGDYEITLAAANGCDSTVFLTLNILPVPLTEIFATVCAGEIFNFNGQNYGQTGDYFFTATAENGCDSITVLSLEVLPKIETQLSAAICMGSIFVFDGNDLSASGNYSAIFTAENGCDSTVNLNLIVVQNFQTALSASICEGETFEFDGNQLDASGIFTQILTSSGGCDSILTLNLAVLPFSKTDISASICPGETYNFGGQQLSSGGTFTGLFTNSVGCDSIVTLELDVLPESFSNQAATICDGETYPFQNATLTQSGTYVEILTGANGCDSTVTLALTVLPTFSSGFSATICDGETFDFGGEILTDGGIYSAVLTAANGCDSTVNLNLTVLPAISKSITARICAGQTYLFGNEILTDGGIYSTVFPAANGCDSTVNLNLTVLPQIQTTLNIDTCANNFQFAGQNLTANGTYSAVFQAANGCDSTVVLNLVLHEVPADVNLSVRICAEETYEFFGQILNQSGSYSAAAVTPNGCVYRVNLMLFVRPANITTLNASVCAGESYNFGGQILTVSGAYSAIFEAANGCDSTVNLNLLVNPTINNTIVLQNNQLFASATNVIFQWINCTTNQPIVGATADVFAPTVSGSYAVLIADMNGCTTQSECLNVTIIGTDEPLEFENWKILPNPASHFAEIIFEKPLAESLRLEIFDAAGRKVFSNELAAGTVRHALDLMDLPAGILSVRLLGEHGTGQKFLVKMSN